MDGKEIDKVWNAAVNSTVDCILESIDWVERRLTKDAPKFDEGVAAACDGIRSQARGLMKGGRK